MPLSESGRRAAYRRANAEKLINPPGSTFLYSDINFIVLGELVQKVSATRTVKDRMTVFLGSAAGSLCSASVPG